METQKILQSVEKLADKLGTKAELLFGYYMKEAKLFKVYFWIRLFLSVVVTVIGLIICRYTDGQFFELSVGNQMLFVFGCFCFLTGVIIFTITLFEIENYIRAIKNPEYIAMEDLFRSLIKD